MVSRSAWSGLPELEGDLRAYLGRRCRDASELDDVVQETLLRAARFRPTVCDPRSLRGWTMRIGGNVLRDKQRSESRMPRNGQAGSRAFEELSDERDALDDDEGHSILMGGRWVGRGEATQILGWALGRLSKADQTVLEAYYRHGCSTAHIASQQTLPRELVKVRLFRARKRLAERLAAVGFPAIGKVGR